jgi:GT2 family glycosyltransferase
MPADVPKASLSLAQLGCVLIGRNEGDRFRQCIESLPAALGAVVYVDSGSTDGSVALARSRGIDVVELDLSVPFTAARARNAGFERLRKTHPDLAAVQFVDGDCALVLGWVEAAAAALGDSPERAAVCGWRRERFPERSIYNRFCDLEWIAGAVGDVGPFGFGGDVLIRSEALAAVGGYDGSLIAAEDTELCARLRARGFEMIRIDRPMTLHDADIHRFGQWWTRSKRAGHATLEVSRLHRATGLFARHVRSISIWGAFLPLLLLASPFVLGAGAGLVWLAVAALYALQVRRIARSQDPARYSPQDALVWGISCMASQPPKALGMLDYVWSRLLGRQRKIIEYK